MGSSTGILGRMSFRVEVWDSRLRGNDGGGAGMTVVAQVYDDARGVGMTVVVRGMTVVGVGFPPTRE